MGLRLLDSELPWMVGTERSKNRQGMLWTTGRPEQQAMSVNPQTREGFSRGFRLHVENVPPWAHCEPLVLSWCFEKL